ncbi:MAG: DUF1127 domain-containing protein [Desulfuromusa sp.]|jgi:uncharacterized protein YjiS (DUF1127 family)|nr:DUF1127 domain-containing protein [Desulfuromusa sp.]
MLIEQYHPQHWGHSTHGFWQNFGRTLQNLGRRMERLSQLAEQRQQLLEMDDHMLKDIGISRAEARQIAKGR